MRKRSGWLVVLPNTFSALAGVVLLGAMGWAADPANGDRTLAESPWEPCLFFLSHLTPPLYALPYILRAARLVILYDTSLRVRFQCLTGPLCPVAIVGTLTGVHTAAALLTRWLAEPSTASVPRLGLFYEDWAVFVGLLLVYVVGVLVVQAAIAKYGVSDRFQILRELQACLAAWVCLAGLHFVYMLLALNLEPVRRFERRFVPSHLLLVFMFAFTYHATVGVPLIFGKRGLRGFVRRQCRLVRNAGALCGCARPPHADSSADSEGVGSADIAEADRIDKAALEEGVAAGNTGEDARTFGVLRLLGIGGIDTCTSDSESDRSHSEDDDDDDLENQDEEDESLQRQTGRAASRSSGATRAQPLAIAVVASPRDVVSPTLILDPGLQEVLGLKHATPDPAAAPAGQSLVRYGSVVQHAFSRAGHSRATMSQSPDPGQATAAAAGQDMLLLDRAHAVSIKMLPPADREAAVEYLGQSPRVAGGLVGFIRTLSGTPKAGARTASRASLGSSPGGEPRQAGAPPSQQGKVQLADGEPCQRRIRQPWAEKLASEAVTTARRSRTPDASAIHCPSPLQIDTKAGVILVDIEPLRVLGGRIAALFLAPGAPLEVNIGDRDRRAVGQRLFDDLGVSTAIPRGGAPRKQRKRASVFPGFGKRKGTGGKLGLPSFNSLSGDESSAEVVQAFERLASVFDAALVEIVRSVALNIYGPFWSTGLAPRLALLDMESATEAHGASFIRRP
ncbi:hypothetical protein FNF31_01838 [Cafeteria roenbergensis]|uniref:Uncharacterized protein n=1 Tax=Cafeteria roenbergensis TaxID=33653 RepID=A0A5A8DNG1_CAFRO|nr:hypothetical protein FNF31_01838 [Cafeteria roenbergensis]